MPGITTAATRRPGTAPGRVTAPRRRLHIKRYLEGYLLISPWIIGFLAFTVVPMIMTFSLSATDYDVISPPLFTGLDNLRRLLQDDVFGTALTNTFILSALSVIPRISLALLLAVLLNQGLRGTGIFRTIFYLPTVIPAFSSVYMWVILMTPGSGLLNVILQGLGLPTLPWLTDPDTAKPSLALMMAYYFGPQMLIFLAALQGVPNELLEAAHIDGAGTVRRFVSVTLPLITPALFFNVVVLVIETLQMFTYPFLSTMGGPVNSTVTNVMYIYQQGFQNLKMGYAALMSTILFLIIMVLTAIQFRLSRWVYYETNV